MVVSRGTPAGIQLMQECFNLGRHKRTFYQSSVWFLTFVAYTAFALSRRPLAVVKNSLNQDCSKLTPPPDLVLTNDTLHNWCDWAPFNGDNSNRLLGLMDSAFLFAYALCMFVSGMVAERIDLRYFLTSGMLFSGFCTYLFGLAFYLNIHNLAFFIIIQILAGAAQCTGWPGVVSCIGNWFGEGRRGLIFGIWNAHVYVGNIAGAYIAGYFVAHNWGLSFIVPGAIIGFVGFCLFLFLAPHPEAVGCSTIDDHGTEKRIEHDDKCHYFNGEDKEYKFSRSDSFTEKSPLVSQTSQRIEKKAITFWDAVKIPGVVEFSLCLFFSKLVSYTFLFWLPRYLSHTTEVGSEVSAYLSIAFDVGGILGGIAAGVISDHTGSSALTCAGFLSLTIPALFAFETYGAVSRTSNIILQIICGVLVNGPYALITTAVSTELGTHESIRSNSKALSTVTAIIDGTGSIGAAIGPLIAGMISELSWSYVFYMMMLADILALLSLLRTALKEVKQCYRLRCRLPFVNVRSDGI